MTFYKGYIKCWLSQTDPVCQWFVWPLWPLTSCCVSSVLQVSTEGALSDSTLPLTVFVSRAPVSGPDVERVSTGTKFALELWLRTLETPDLWHPHPAGIRNDSSGPEKWLFVNVTFIFMCSESHLLFINKTHLKQKRLSNTTWGFRPPRGSVDILKSGSPCGPPKISVALFSQEAGTFMVSS